MAVSMDVFLTIGEYYDKVNILFQVVHGSRQIKKKTLSKFP